MTGSEVADGVTQSELAFLALGLLLGIATGAAIVMVLRSRPPTHEIRVTVTRDAIPRRATTLAADVFRGPHAGPAPGGPGDRRSVDRDDGSDRTTVRPDGRPVVASPSLPWQSQPAASLVPVLGPEAAPAPAGGHAGAIRIHPTPDPILARLGLAPAATATAVAASADPAAHPVAPPEAAETSPTSEDGGPILPGLLAGDHQAMQRLIDAIGGPDDESRRAWDTLLTRFVGAVRQRAIDIGLIDLPMGNPFWDTFTIDQCRQIVVALASTGRRFDGRSEWLDGNVPTYRDLSRALAESGIDPRRVRAWPNSLEIADLFRGAGVAALEAVGRWAPDVDEASLRAFLGERDRGLDELWPVWDAVRVRLDEDLAGA
ncbi:MAG: hypothetical protein HY263_01805 [Chloroflexi bacterium]|nr:hypothetical protein [Chloroflexota bacterium]